MTGFVFDAWSALVLAGLLALIGAAMWAFIPRWHGILPASSRPRWIRRALSQVDLQPGEVLVDLGSGTGGGLLIAAREYGARAVGYEIEPLHCAYAWLRAVLGGVARRVSVRCRDLYQADLSQADVVYLYLNPTYVEALRQALATRLRPGARVVSLDFPFEGWQPAHVDIGYLIFSYTMPPSAGSLDAYLSEHLTPLPKAQGEPEPPGAPSRPDGPSVPRSAAEAGRPPGQPTLR
ncbi:MAG: class I SAM-dependent methyltransferase [Anaerolineae bacterium]|nr:class I SAM-dependent methyltransferase [Anaerolineae bacterium]